MSSEITAYTTQFNERTAPGGTSSRPSSTGCARSRPTGRLELADPDGRESTPFDALRAQYYAERNKFIELARRSWARRTASTRCRRPRSMTSTARCSRRPRAMLAAARGAGTRRRSRPRPRSRPRSSGHEGSPRARPEDRRVTTSSLRVKKSLEDRYNILRAGCRPARSSDRMSTQLRLVERPPARPGAASRPSPVSPSLPRQRRGRGRCCRCCSASASCS